MEQVGIKTLSFQNKQNPYYSCLKNHFYFAPRNLAAERGAILLLLPPLLLPVVAMKRGMPCQPSLPHNKNKFIDV